MRLFIIGLLFIALLGCVTPEESADVPTSEIEEIVGENETNPEEIPVEENITEEMNESEGTEIIEEETINETANETIGDEPEGIFFGEGKYMLIIDDVVWYGDKSCAAVRIADSNGTTIKSDVICPLVDYYWISPEGRHFRIKITEVAAGYSGEAWAKAVIYG